MSRGELNPLGIKIIADDSQALSSLRGAMAKMQAEVESRGIKVPITVDAAGGGATRGGATFATAGTVAPGILGAGAGTYAPNRPASIAGAGGFNRGAYSQSVADRLMRGEIDVAEAARLTSPAAISQASREYSAAIQGERAREQLARKFHAETSVMAEQGLRPESIFAGVIQSPEAFAASEAERGAGMRGRAFAYAGRLERRYAQLEMRQAHARRTHALRNAIDNAPNPEDLDELAAMEAQRGGAVNAAYAAETAAIRSQYGVSGFIGRQFSRTSGRKLLATGLLAAHELYRAGVSIDQGDLDATLATTPGDELRARIQQQRQAWGGLFGSVGAVALDLFGAGPESFALGAGRSLAVSESQDRLRASQLAARFGEETRGALATGNEVEARRVKARATLAQADAEYAPQIQTIQAKLRETRQERYATGEVMPMPDMAVTPGVSQPDPNVYTTRTVNVVQGESRQALQNKLAELQNLLAEATKNATAEIDSLNRQVGIAVRQMGTGTRVAILRATGHITRANFAEALGAGTEGILAAPPEARAAAVDAGVAGLIGATSDAIGTGLGYVGRYGGIAIDARSRMRQVGVMQRRRIFGAFAGQQEQINVDEQEQLDRTQGLPIVFRWLAQGAIKAESRERRQDVETQRKERADLIDVQIEGRGLALDYLKKHNRIGAESASLAASAIVEARELRKDFPQQAAGVLQNAMKEQDLLKQNYVDSFRAVQFDTRENIVSPRDQESIGDVMKALRDTVGRIEQAMERLAPEQ